MIDKDMLPVLKGHVFFAEIETGVYFNGGSERTFVLQGKGLYPLVSKLVAAMNGAATAGSLGESLPAKVHPLFWKLLSELSSRNLLIDFRGVDDLLPPHYWDLFGDTLGYFRDNVAGFAAAFRQWRDTPVLAAGSGYVLKSLVRALARSGVQTITVVDDGSAPDGPSLEETTAALADHRGRDVEFTFEVLSAEDCMNGRFSARRIVYGSDAIDGRAFSPVLHSLLQRQGGRLLAGGILDGEGFVGPESFDDASSLRDLVERLKPKLDGPRHSLMSRSVIGNLLALEAMRSEVGLPRGGKKGPKALLRNWMLHVSPGPEIILRPIIPALRKGAAAVAIEIPEDAVELPGDREPTEFEQISARLTAMFDLRTGIFSRDPGRKIGQLPLAHDAIEVFWPRSCGLDPAVVTAWGLDASDAGKRTLLAAVSRYACGVEAALRLSRSGTLVAGIDESDWRSRALVEAITRNSDLCNDMVVYALATDTIRLPVTRTEDPSQTWRLLSTARDARTLVRLIHLYRPDPPDILLGQYGKGGPFVCAARVKGAVAEGSGLSAQVALVECLGELCSRLQLNSPDTTDVGPEWTRGSREREAFRWEEHQGNIDLAAIQSWLDQQSFRIREHRFEADQVLAAYGFGIGSISLERS